MIKNSLNIFANGIGMCGHKLKSAEVVFAIPVPGEAFSYAVANRFEIVEIGGAPVQSR
jgi:hypothetical protein